MLPKLQEYKLVLGTYDEYGYRSSHFICKQKTEKKLYFFTLLDIFWSYLREKRPGINQNEGSTFYPVIKEFQGHLLTVHGSVVSNFVKSKKFIQHEKP